MPCRCGHRLKDHRGRGGSCRARSCGGQCNAYAPEIWQAALCDHPILRGQDAPQVLEAQCSSCREMVNVSRWLADRRDFYLVARDSSQAQLLRTVTDVGNGGREFDLCVCRHSLGRHWDWSLGCDCCACELFQPMPRGAAGVRQNPPAVIALEPGPRKFWSNED